MSQILPGVYPVIKAGDLVVSKPVSLNVLGLIGTANKGPLNTPILISSIQEAYETFGFPDEYDSTAQMEELTLSRGIQIAFDAGASSIYAVRVASSSATKASRDIISSSGTCVTLTAVSEGTWGNELQYLVEIADGNTFMDYHTDKHSGYVEDSYTDALTNSNPFSYLALTSALNYYAEAHSGNKVRVVYASGTGTSVDMNIIHSDAHTFQEFSEIDGDVSDSEETTGDVICQTFTTIDAATITGVRLRMKYSSSTPTGGDCIVRLYATDSNGMPTGTALATAIIAWSTIDLDATYSTVLFTFTTPYVMQADTKYAITVSWGGTRTSGDFIVGGLSTNGTDIYTKGDAYFATNGLPGIGTFSPSSTVEDYMLDVVISIPENTCEFVINNWGVSYPSAHKKHIRWSNISTPTNTTYAYIDYYTATSRKVTIKYGGKEEYFWVVDGDDLVTDVNASSTLVTAEAETYSSEEPSTTVTWQNFGLGAGTTGNNGATDVSSGDYVTGLEVMESVFVHVIACPGRYDRATISALVTHCTNMSKSGMEHERIAVAGHAYGYGLEQVLGFSGPYANKRLILVTPGIDKINVATGEIESLSAAYTAVYLAGWLCSGDISEANLMKAVNTVGLETIYTKPQLEQIVQRRINPIGQLVEGGYMWHESITTSTDSEWREITTVRIVDYATYGLRSVCRQFIGRKNLADNRSAIRNAVEKFFDDMVSKQMLSTTGDNPYSVSVEATREDETMGKVKVIVSYKPVMAIKYIDLIEYIK